MIQSILLLIIIVICILKVNVIIDFIVHFFQFLYWIRRDIKKAYLDRKKGIKKFKPYGLKMFVGRQGYGKTISMVHTLNEYHRLYPKALIVTNFEYKYANHEMYSLLDLLNIRNGEDGVIFAIDELQNEFSCQTSKDFPETLLSTITMQRKNKICILATSQVFTRVSKPLREQCYEVIECKTIFGRWTRMKCYDADDYNYIVDNYDPKKKFKTPKKWKKSYIQTDDLRQCYDTYAIVRRMSREGFVSRVS